MNKFKSGLPEFPPSSETPEEKEHFEPRVVIDIIRHGQSVYGAELKRQIEALGYGWSEAIGSAQVSGEKMRDSRAVTEGQITPEGDAQLRETVRALVPQIDQDNEVVLVLASPRFRTADSARIIIDELGRQAVNVQGAREHLDLIDLKPPWLTVLEFIKRKSGSTERPVQHWLKISEEELHKADLETIKDIENRMGHFIRLVQRFAKMKRGDWHLDKKTLRVIAVTHGLNISATPKEKVSDSSGSNQGEYGQIVELDVT